MVAFIQTKSWELYYKKTFQLNKKRLCVFQLKFEQNYSEKKRARKMHVLCVMLVKTRGVRYFSVETWILFAHPINISGSAPVLNSIQVF